MKERETSKPPKGFQDFLVMYKQDVSEQKKFNELLLSLPTIKKEIAELKNNK